MSFWVMGGNMSEKSKQWYGITPILSPATGEYEALVQVLSTYLAQFGIELDGGGFMAGRCMLSASKPLEEWPTEAEPAKYILRSFLRRELGCPLHVKQEINNHFEKYYPYTFNRLRYLVGEEARRALGL
jgi:hypothetical protein